jgi:hypothetical protein
MSTNLRLVAPENDRPVLTCWKDIAQYVGKSVRTLQRWERESGFPVRRTKSREKGVRIDQIEERCSSLFMSCG